MDVMASTTLEIPVGPELTPAQAEATYARGNGAVVYALLQLAKQLAEARETRSPSVTPSTPSGMVPPYEKPPAQGSRKRLGAKLGHPGSRRATSERVDHRIKHRANRCPDCDGENRTAKTTSNG
jgi:hypothetical protein